MGTDRNFPAPGAPAPPPPVSDSKFDEPMGDTEIRGLKSRSRGRGLSCTLAILLILALLVAGALFIVLMYLPAERQASELQTQLAEAQEQTEGAQTQAQSLETERDSLRTERDRLRTERDSMQQQRDALQEQRGELAASVEQRDARLTELETAQQQLERRLRREIRRGDVRVRSARGQLSVDLRDRILFPPGGVTLREPGQRVLRQVAESLAEARSNVIQVGGHTDPTPLGPTLQAQFPTNWELSAARATNVVRFLETECGIPGDRLIAAGFSQHRPVTSNATKAGRRRNRRIELVLLPRPAAVQ